MVKNFIKFLTAKEIAINFLKEEKVAGAIWENTRSSVRVALVYPNNYRVGMSNLGFQTVYNLANSVDNVRCERAFLPEFNTKPPQKVLTIETQTPIERFDIIAFSISFENDILSVLSILKKAGLPILCKQRSLDAPLILAGGVLCLLNPEPLAPFVDCLLVGEAENTLKQFFITFNPNKQKNKNLIDIACQIPSLYVPTFFRTKYTEKGTIKELTAIEKVPRIERSIVNDITTKPTNTSVLTPNTAFSNTFLIEISRGCNYGCRFCSAGYIYRPQRFQSQEIIKEQIENGIKLTNKIGLVGASISDYPNINKLFSEPKLDNINFSLSSLRADCVNNKIINIFKKNNIKTVTIAPDAGSERLRRVINKGITEEHILNTTKLLVLGGIPNLKMYFLVGLPTETDYDVEAIITLCKKVKACFLEFSRIKRRIGQITISLNPFVPKPFTPFQWSAMDKVNLLKKKINTVKQGLKHIANLNIQTESIRTSYIQALIARGDRKVAEILISAHKNNHNWPKTLKESKISSDFYVNRKRTFDEIFPWDFLKKCVSKKFLLREYKLAMDGRISKSCSVKIENCNLCGICSHLKNNLKK